MSREMLSRREFLAGSAAAGATILLPGVLSAAPDGKKTFTILHTNDMHSSFIGMGPAADYTPFTLDDDATRGGYARLAGLIAKRREARTDRGPVLVLDAGDFSMGTAFGAASRETGGELQLMSRMGYDATTFGNHEFDLGPDGLGKAIAVAAKAGRAPAVLASNTNFAKDDATLADLKRLARDGVIRRYVVIERGGIRFGLFGLLGKEAQFYTGGAGAAAFTDAIETGKEMVQALRETEKVDVVIALSHGGVQKGADGRFRDGDDVRLAKEVPGIDVVIGGHSHDMSRTKFDVVTAIELGDHDRGYEAIDIGGKDERLYSLTCPLYLGLILTAIPKYTKGKLPLVAKNKDGQPLKSRVEALDDRRTDSPYLLPPPGTTDEGSIATGAGKDAVREIKEWQAIMDHLRSLPVKTPGELPVIPVDERAAEVRAIKVN